MPEKAGGMKRHASVLNALECFLERVHDEPEDAAHFTEKVATDLTNSLGNQNGRLSVCHEREVASLRHREKDKVKRTVQALKRKRAAPECRFNSFNASTHIAWAKHFDIIRGDALDWHP